MIGIVPVRYTVNHNNSPYNAPSWFIEISTIIDAFVVFNAITYVPRSYINSVVLVIQN